MHIECYLGAGGNKTFGRPRRRWEDNIKMDLREVGYDGRDWINLAEDRDRWRAYVRAAMNLLKNSKMSEANVSVVGSQQNLVPVSSRRASLKKRTRLEIRLLVVIAILVILLLIFLFIIIILACEVENNEPGK
ncbi:hypothetical protein ANN_09073 [Periplaneta americana]|uniref:Uncharacterized protein n=1 Tax=Periplaneta americana TaxID=6978 RepID=A0ABQ8TKE0_PERAM|nr:hypothetical protein ANN_09073 [Periplaneta americana]